MNYLYNQESIQFFYEKLKKIPEQISLAKYMLDLNEKLTKHQDKKIESNLVVHSENPYYNIEENI